MALEGALGTAHRVGVDEMSLTERLARWVEANRAQLAPTWTVMFRDCEVSHDKPCAHLVLSRGDRFDEMIVWDSGDVEVSYGTADRPHDEHHEVDDPSALDALLEDLVRRVGQ